ncbi:isopentenyl-diphosphate Delta-isomerase [Armatimonas sp.]|uniref:isopentenyl-diphosphate Delta-isomerase n=1 Tax=Armatimonas sp. TaxID=1872638 RepID=UPI003750CECC
MQENVILVDANDNAIGSCEKLAAHLYGGQLHRAFSVFIFNDKNCLLLQQRALEKYHFGGLWTNTCCSHPRPGETTLTAAQRRLTEELGFTVALTELGQFLYRAEDPATGLTEHELDHVFIGHFTGEPTPNPAEVMDWRWQAMEQVEAELLASPERFTPWFPRALAYTRRALL